MPRYSFDALVGFATDLLSAAKAPRDKAAPTAELLVTADAMGHTTHGLALLPGYIEEIEAGSMALEGEPEVIADRGAAVVWDGRRLPGLWLTRRAIDVAIERAKRFGLASVAIRRSHHIGCLAVFLPQATEAGMMALIASSDPSDAHVAPFGGRRAVFTPDPIAVGIPTSGDPILIDISSSITTAGMSGRLIKEGRRFPGAWAIDATGNATDDPNVLDADPPGALLPVGGLDHGHKGYGLALTVEALTQGLSGHGRADGERQWGACVFVQVWDPEAFAGSEPYQRQTQWIADACRRTPPIDPGRPVRLPGGEALARLRESRSRGVDLYGGLLERLDPLSRRLGVSMPCTPEPSG